MNLGRLKAVLAFAALANGASSAGRPEVGLRRGISEAGGMSGDRQLQSADYDCFLGFSYLQVLDAFRSSGVEPTAEAREGVERLIRAASELNSYGRAQSDVIDALDSEIQTSVRGILTYLIEQTAKGSATNGWGDFNIDGIWGAGVSDTVPGYGQRVLADDDVQLVCNEMPENHPAPAPEFVPAPAPTEQGYTTETVITTAESASTTAELAASTAILNTTVGSATTDAVTTELEFTTAEPASTTISKTTVRKDTTIGAATELAVSTAELEDTTAAATTTTTTTTTITVMETEGFPSVPVTTGFSVSSVYPVSSGHIVTSGDIGTTDGGSGSRFTFLTLRNGTGTRPSSSTPVIGVTTDDAYHTRGALVTTAHALTTTSSSAGGGPVPILNQPTTTTGVGVVNQELPIWALSLIGVFSASAVSALIAGLVLNRHKLFGTNSDDESDSGSVGSVADGGIELNGLHRTARPTLEEGKCD